MKKSMGGHVTMRNVSAVLLRAGLLVLLLGSASFSAHAQDEFTDEGDVVQALPGPQPPLDLQACIDLAVVANPLLQQEREGRAELEARKTQARAEGFPRLELQGSWSRGRDPSFALDESFAGGGDDSGAGFFDALVGPLYDQFPALTPPELGSFSFIPDPAAVPAQTFYRTFLDAYWELRPTRVWRAVRAARSAIERQDHRVSDLENRTIEATIQSYHRVVLAHERLAAMEREIQAREEFLAITRRRFFLDFATPLDTLQAAVSLANLRPEERRRRNELRQTGQQLNLLLGRDPLTPLGVVATFPLEDEQVSAELALDLALRRPDVQAQRLQTDLYELQRGVAKANNHPYLTIEGQYGYVTRELAELTDEGHDFWRGAVTLHLPIFDGLTTRGQAKEAEAAIRRNEFRVDEIEMQVRDEVLSSLEELAIARANLEAAVLNMQRAEDAFVQISLRYELGKGDNLQVLNAQSDRFTARSTLIDARYQVLSSLATLKRAMGVSPRLPLSFVLQSNPGRDSQESVQ
jgi:outer membrane protein TolC